MTVNIVVGTVDLEWIAGRFARELVARLPAYGVDAVINGGQQDLEFQQIVYGEPTSRPAVGMFTHGDFRPKRFAQAYDGQISLNSAMHQYLLDAGAEHATVIEPVVDACFTPGRPLIFGVAGRVYQDGRKGEALVVKMLEAGYTVLAWGHGWPCSIISTRYEDLPSFYRTLDYYVDTSSDEGGCIPAIEAMSMGVPVISHTVGVERPVLGYERSNWESLNNVLRALTQPRTYDDWAREHAAYFHSVLARVQVAA